MKIYVPFVKRSILWKGKNWCGPIALASLLRYYRDETPVKEIVKKVGTKNFGTSPRALALFCLSKGFKVDYQNEFIRTKTNRSRYSRRLKNYLEEINEAQSDSIFKKKCESFSKYNFIKKRSTINHIENYLRQKKPVLLYLNIARIESIDDLLPHYILVVGYDKNNVFIHNTYPKNQAYQKISKKTFMKAWGSDGMDLTLIVPFK